MSQADIDIFVDSARYGSFASARDGTLTPHDVSTAVARGIPVNGRHSRNGFTALHWAVRCERRELVVALLAHGVDANVKEAHGQTSVLWAALYNIPAYILQLMIEGGGSVNEACNGWTPLMTLRSTIGDAAARLQVLLACPELELDAVHNGKTAEENAVSKGDLGIAAAIAEERARRKRWSAFRLTWVAAIRAPTVTPFIV
jgi:hypothetical protein